MCHSRSHHRSPRPSVEAPTRSEPGLRASDAERDSTVSLLRAHSAAGRLDVEELEQRIGGAYAATTRGELAALLADLPGSAPVPGTAAAPRRHDAGHGWGGFVQVNVLLVAIWALSGAGYFWPAWVMAFWGLALVMKTAPRLLGPARLHR